MEQNMGTHLFGSPCTLISLIFLN